jgi:hypothetical protein
MRFKMFSTEGIVWMPKRGEYFRIGPWTGSCVMVTKRFIIMDQKGRIKI